MLTKICTKCGKEKPLDEYAKQKNGKFGRRPNCKVCVRDKIGYHKGRRSGIIVAKEEYVPKKGQSFRAFVRHCHKEHYCSPFVCKVVNTKREFVETDKLRFGFEDYYFQKIE